MAAHVYHWKHGWIPLDHTAALSKAKGNHKTAARYLADAHSRSAGINTRRDVAKAAQELHTVPSHDRANAAAQVRDAAQKHGMEHLLHGASWQRGELTSGGRSVGTTYTKGSTSVHFAQNHDEAKRQTFLEKVDRAIAATGRSDKRTEIVVDGSDRMFRRGRNGSQTHAYVDRKTAHSGLITVGGHIVDDPSSAKVGGSNFMPAQAADPVSYVLVHELGHVHDAEHKHTTGPRNQHEVDWHIHTHDTKPAETSFWRGNKANHSAYGNANTSEGYAEAYAQFILGGASSNPTVAAYAARYGWK